jgi:D-cysteine desulfhydrase family pyridoxal phosphate-dependent enzyme
LQAYDFVLKKEEKMGIAELAKVSLGYYPTPFEELKRLSEEIGGPRIWVKRDDLTGLSYGGSKTRSLEMLIGQAAQMGADTIITCGPVTSNHARLTAAAARKLGLSCILVLKSTENVNSVQGNMLLNKILNIEIVLSNVETLDMLVPIMEEVAAKIEKQGKRPYIIPGGGYSPIGAVGYIGLVEELNQQAAENNIKIDAVIFASGSGCTQTGLIVGKELLNADMQIIGLTINREKNVLIDRIYSDAVKAFELLSSERSIKKDQIIVLDDYLGPAYAVPSPECLNAIHHLAELEGLILDPCYTGKSMAGLIDLAKKKFKKGDNIVFLHTGGSPGVFTYSDIFNCPDSAAYTNC